MEDVHVFHHPGTWNAPEEHATFIGVYDGHGGRGTVDYLEDNLSKNVANEWRYSVNPDDDNNLNDENKCVDGHKRRKLADEATKTRSSDSNDSKNDEGLAIRTALERAFLLTDVQSRMDGIQTSGATVACCIVLPKFIEGTLDSIYVHCANAGDARIVLSNTTARLANSNASHMHSSNEKGKAEDENAVRLTHDHKATDPEEITRIQNSGGIMLRGRVLGVLAVARSLGDHGLKEFVIGRPYLSSTVVKIEKNKVISGWRKNSEDDEKNTSMTDGEFLIVACDGLWDVMQDQEAVNLVRDFVHDTTSIHSAKSRREKVARFLIDEALRRGSTDNITVIVYWL